MNLYFKTTVRTIYVYVMFSREDSISFFPVSLILPPFRCISVPSFRTILNPLPVPSHSSSSPSLRHPLSYIAPSASTSVCAQHFSTEGALPISAPRDCAAIGVMPHGTYIHNSACCSPCFYPYRRYYIRFSTSRTSEYK